MLGRSPRKRLAFPVVEEFRSKQIELAHGSGGTASRRLVEELILPHLRNPILEKLTDSALVPFGDAGTVAVTADSFVVSPLRFAGGSIGTLAVNGTVNDLAVSGARPIALVCTLILEAGLPTATLDAELAAMAKASQTAGVPIVGGDTKVVEHGKADGLYITTAGIGLPIAGVKLDARSAKAGDKVILSGPIGDHGITILLARGELDMEADIASDCRSVWPMVKAIIEAVGSQIRWMRDPTRGGLASALNEFARASGLCVTLQEELLPVRDQVRGACELLGLDVLHVANEGQFLAIVAPGAAAMALEAMRATKYGAAATIIGEVQEGAPCLEVVTAHGSSRVVDMLVGDQLPRIC